MKRWFKSVPNGQKIVTFGDLVFAFVFVVFAVPVIMLLFAVVYESVSEHFGFSIASLIGFPIDPRSGELLASSPYVLKALYIFLGGFVLSGLSPPLSLFAMIFGVPLFIFALRLGVAGLATTACLGAAIGFATFRVFIDGTNDVGLNNDEDYWLGIGMGTFLSSSFWFAVWRLRPEAFLKFTKTKKGTAT